MYSAKKIYAVYNGDSGKTPETGEFLRIFVLKLGNLTVSKVTFNCKLQKILGQQDVLVAPQ